MRNLLKIFLYETNKLILGHQFAYDTCVQFEPIRQLDYLIYQYLTCFADL